MGVAANAGNVMLAIIATKTLAAFHRRPSACLSAFIGGSSV